MQYTCINDYVKVTALQERMNQLEQAHYSNSVYLMEATAVGDQTAIEKYKTENLGIDIQYEALKAEHDRLVAELERNNPNEDSEDDAGELRSEPSR